MKKIGSSKLMNKAVYIEITSEVKLRSVSVRS